MSLELAQATSEQAPLGLGIAVRGRNNVATRFRPGASGNPGGRPRIARFRQEAIKQLKQEVAPGVTRLACLIDRQIDKACDDTSAATFLRDTVDGKPQAASDDSEAPRISIAIDVIGTVNVGK